MIEDTLTCGAEGCDRPAKRVARTSRYHAEGDILEHCGQAKCRANIRRRKAGRPSSRTMVPCNWCGDLTEIGNSRILNERGTITAHCSAKCRIDSRASNPAQVAGAPLTTIEAVWLLVGQGFACRGCGVMYPMPIFDVDHIDPKANGGDDGIGNIQMLCRSCNSSKSNRSMEYFQRTGLIWDEMRLSIEDACHNFLNYCRHKRLRKRCAALIRGDVMPQRDRELQVAPMLLRLIGDHSQGERP